MDDQRYEQLEKKFFNRLGRLFDNNVIIRRVDKGLKVIDTAKLQSTGNKANSRFVDRFARLHGGGGRQGFTANNHYNYHASRVEIYTDYEAMDKDAIIAAGLDIYADETTMKNPKGEIVEVVTDDENIKNLLENLLYDILNVDYNMWPWVRQFCKYGDFFLYLHIMPSLGIVDVTPLSAFDVIRVEGEDPDNPLTWWFEHKVETSPLTKGQRYHNFEIAHFRLMNDANFLPYGRSMLEPARKIFKQLTLMEDAMLIHRIMRAPEKRVFKIDVGNIPPHEVDNFMNMVINESKKVPYVDPSTGEYNLKYNMQNILEDYYLPVRGGQSGTEIETLSGLQYDGINDVEYLRDKLLSALKIPKAFLNYEADINAKATLAAEDVRFSRTIERMQQIILSELKRVCIIHLYSQGYEGEDLAAFDLKMYSPSIIHEQEKLNLLNQQVTLIRDAIEAKIMSKHKMYTEILNLSEEEIEEERARLVEDAKEEYILETIKSQGSVQPEGEEESDPFANPAGDEEGDQEQPQDQDIANDPTPEEGLIGPDGGSLPGGQPGAGRPKEVPKVGSVNHPRGNNPIGSRARRESIDRKYENLMQELEDKFGNDLKGKKGNSGLIKD